MELARKGNTRAHVQVKLGASSFASLLLRKSSLRLLSSLEPHDVLQNDHWDRPSLLFNPFQSLTIAYYAVSANAANLDKTMPPAQSHYFPPLDKCLAGEDRLISWKVAYIALRDPSLAVENATLEAFLTDPESTHILTNSLDPYLRPGAKTKSDFETKTAPIHVSQSASGSYDVEELKRDAVWLSEKVGVEELVALRVAIVEWQQRAEDQLLADTSRVGNDAVAASAQFGTSNPRASTFATSTNGVAVPALDSRKEETRRERQLHLYLEEKSYILKIGTELVNRVAARDLVAKTGRTWIDELAEKLIQDQCSVNDPTEHESFCSTCIEIIEGWIHKSDDVSKRPEAFRTGETNQMMFMASTFVDMTSAFRLLLANVYMFQSVPSHPVVSSWFRLMSKVNFLQNATATPALSDPSTMQSLVSLISLTVLRASEVMSRIQDTANTVLRNDVHYPHLTGNSYFQNDACMREVNLALYRAAQATYTVAAPAIYAWSLITATLRDVGKVLLDAREQQRMLEEGSSDGEALDRRRSSRGDSAEETSVVEKQYDLLRSSDIETGHQDDLPAFLASAAVDVMDVYAVMSQLSIVLSTAYGSPFDEATSYFGRDGLFDLMREGMKIATYGGEVLDAILSVLAPDVHRRSSKLDSYFADRFLSDYDCFRPAVLEQALARYPYELSPLLRLMTALSSASSQRTAGSPDLVQLLEHLQTMTIKVTGQFRSYQLDHEDENVNNMLLTDELPLFVSKQAVSLFGNNYIGQRQLAMGSGEDQRSNVHGIPTGAAGIVVKESRPLVFRLEHPHSGLEYIGLLLSTILPNSELVAAPLDTGLDRATGAEIVLLINGLLTSSMRQHQGVEEARFILGRLGYALHDETDIISIIADILEMELLAHLDQTIQEGSLELLVACAEFLDKLITISSERVWSALSRSSLLGINGGAYALAAVVGVTEVQVGHYRFLAACVSLYSHLIDDAIAGLVKRRAKVNRTTNRFDSPMSSQDSTPERTMSMVLNAYQEVLLDAWQSLGEWRFAVPQEKAEIATLILSSFERLLRSSYGIGLMKPLAKRLSALLISSATSLLDTFSASTGNGTSLQSFTMIFAAGLGIDDDDLTTQHRAALTHQVNAAASFLTTMMRTLSMIDQSGKQASSLGLQAMELTPLVAPLLSVDHSFKRSLPALFAELVRAVNHAGGRDPPSLLEQLSTEASKSLLSIVSQLDRPLRDIQIESSIWASLSTITSCNQQWFAMYLLTGTLPKDRLKSKSTGTVKSKSLLTYALDQLADMAILPPEQAMAMLKFVAAAQDTWVWATNEVRSHAEFLKSALNWLSTLQVPSRAPSTAEELILTSEHQMAAYLCDILAASVHASLEIGDKTVLKLLAPKLDFLRQHAVTVNAYNRSLHRNLSDNFARKFSGCEVDDFRRTAANPAPLGKDYFYDLDLASRVLGHDVAWSGALNGRNQSFADELARANVNLGLVEAQMRLLRSWRVLSTTLSECLGQGVDLEDELAKTAERCLSANTEANLDQPGMDEIVKTRADMAFVIVSKLIGTKAKNEAMKTLLPAVWNLVRASPVDYDVATAPEDLQYYRTLLQLLYLAIQPHAYIASDLSNASRGPQPTDETKTNFLDPAVASCLVEIMMKVVAPGFRALCSNLHDSIDMAQPGDFALITALLQAVLSVPGVTAVYPQLAECVAGSSIVRGALSLYSWADQLAEVMDQDPIYGEVAVMFLLSLSTIRPVAEHMALEGALVQLSSANLSNYFRKPGGKGPFDEPRRMFVIWTEAFLPLCLNLLDAVGPPLAAEVATFLNAFPQQLRRAEWALENRDPSARNPHAGAVTLSLVSEAHSLCLISMILGSDTARGAAEGINAADIPTLDFDHTKVKDTAVGLMRQKTSLAARIVPVGEREAAWSVRSVGGASDNVLQDKVIVEVIGLMQCFGEG